MCFKSRIVFLDYLHDFNWEKYHFYRYNTTSIDNISVNSVFKCSTISLVYVYELWARKKEIILFFIDKVPYYRTGIFIGKKLIIFQILLYE
jgi:hypothetical protein